MSFDTQCLCFSEGAFLKATFPRQNKNDTIEGYREQVHDARLELCQVEKVLTLTPEQWDELAHNLLESQSSIGKGGTANDAPDFPTDLRELLSMSDADMHRWRRTAYRLVTVVAAPERETFVTDAQGYDYPRYVGLDPRPAGAIYFVTLRLTTEIHVQALGFTKFFSLFSWGKSAQEAEETAQAYLLGADIVIEKVLGLSEHAIHQNPSDYTFPEQIYGLPDRLAVEAIRSKGYPFAITDACLKKLREKQQQLRKGQQLLAAQKGSLARPASDTASNSQVL